MVPPRTARLIDANANRAREALRAMEDLARFALNDAALSMSLKTLRHNLADALRQAGAVDFILARDTADDVGLDNKTPTEIRRKNLADVAVAAGKRLSEALRVLEETTKTFNPEAAPLFERMRYEGYKHEQTLARAMAGALTAAKPPALMVLLTESLCRLPWKQTLAAILEGGADCVQLREKGMADGELLSRAREAVAACQARGARCIINDRPDVAILSGADGVHLGQTDLPCATVRAMVGAEMAIGVSTENMNQARAAVRDGATYIGVGPMFKSGTKQKPKVAGPDYAAQAVRELPIPCVAIGGINIGNVSQLIERGVASIAVCAAVIGDADPQARCAELKAALASGGRP